MSVFEAAAMVAHEVNRAYCESLGDKSQTKWAQAPEWQKTSAIGGARAALGDPACGPGDSHAGWLAEKMRTGWTYGPVKDPEKKEHPCMVPYDELPEDQKRKDALFLASVRATSVAWDTLLDYLQSTLDKTHTPHPMQCPE